ncbi:hypothetical protein E2C01_006014 [Portunus trituberculatus]|uniref:Uncharacterized protein n=1 Tax=Portunus trituberculatus TaxID=210409 RepID=A0A5B7CY48_PORTR|nr:hypothetical protein [Portunus trituberculatus]
MTDIYTRTTSHTKREGSQGKASTYIYIHISASGPQGEKGLTLKPHYKGQLCNKLVILKVVSDSTMIIIPSPHGLIH